MSRRLHSLRRLAAAALVAGTAVAQAGPELLAIDAPFRARIAKEKIRLAAQQREAEARGESTSKDAGRCGSQSIGNIDTGGRIGAAPREVFVFAPNAINIVGRGSCR
ncbi:MAG: hypothetical protein ABIX12_03690 [Rubrivivax sp.]